MKAPGEIEWGRLPKLFLRLALLKKTISAIFIIMVFRTHSSCSNQTMPSKHNQQHADETLFNRSNAQNISELSLVILTFSAFSCQLLIQTLLGQNFPKRHLVFALYQAVCSGTQSIGAVEFILFKPRSSAPYPHPVFTNHTSCHRQKLRGIDPR